SATIFNNTFSGNTSAGVHVTSANAWASVRDNIVTGTTGPAPSGALRTSVNGQLFSDFNLLYNNTRNYDDAAMTGLAAGPHDLVGSDPKFVNAAAGNFTLQPTSPAVDKADPALVPPPGGGAVVDMGFKELLAVPLTLLFGQEGISLASGNSGIDK